jgi:signal peptidase I|tara:strand:+ start:919 stop:1551 length:633 start_codon:yes stop_codon:yes gene_type:complete
MKRWKNKLKAFLKKFWFLVWKDDSPKGWVFSIIFIFVLIKFIFFPGLSLVTGTTLPLAIVESCSMYHDGNLFSDYNSWFGRHEEKYSNLEIEKNLFEKFKFKYGLNKGDILFILGTKPEKLKKGDVIVFNANSRNPVIHRIVGINEVNGERTFSTIGDNNGMQLSFEKEISSDKIIGRAVFKTAPYLGWIKLIFFERSRHVSERGFCNEN